MIHALELRIQMMIETKLLEVLFLHRPQMVWSLKGMTQNVEPTAKLNFHRSSAISQGDSVA